MNLTESPTPSSQDTLARLAAVIESRKPVHGGDPDKSYIARLENGHWLPVDPVLKDPASIYTSV